MLWTGKAVADVPFLCYRVEGMKYLAQDDENIVVLAFQCLGFGVELSEVQQLVDEFQQIVGVLLHHIQNPLSVFGVVHKEFLKRVDD